MKIKLQRGGIIETDNPDVIEQFLKYGGEEIKKKATKAPKNSVSSQSDEEA
jgi:hypothetical protein|nr:MAG TPA: hypothetical protein [Caudoviricetes sp.]